MEAFHLQPPADPSADANRTVAIRVIVEQFGSTLGRAQVADVVLTLFDDMPGRETVTTTKASRYVAALWRRYRSKPC